MNQLQKRDYFYLVSSLPETVLDQSREPFTVSEFVSLLEESLEPQDFAKVRLLLLPHDNRNLLRLLRQETENWDKLGQYSESEMQEQLDADSGLPDYMHRFVRAYQNERPINKDQSWEDQLTALYYDYALQNTRGFLHDWLLLERNLRNLLAAWNIREYKIKTEEPFIGKGEIVKTLRASGAHDFGLGNELPFLDKLMNELEQENLLDREKAIDRVQWNYIDDQLTLYYFTIEVVLGYLLQLRMLNRWLSLDKQAGQNRVRAFISDMEQKIELK